LIIRSSSDWSNETSVILERVMSRLSSMTLRVSHTSIDCHNAYELSGWWKQVLGQEDIPDDPNELGSARRSSRIGEALYGPGTGWYVMADPQERRRARRLTGRAMSLSQLVRH
jgi:hypothetical protein